MRRLGDVLLPVLLVGGLLLGLTGCDTGGSSARVNEALTQVDAAIAAGRPAQARQALDDLVLETEQARKSGQLSRSRAEAIEAAAARLAVHLTAAQGR